MLKSIYISIVFLTFTVNFLTAQNPIVPDLGLLNSNYTIQNTSLLFMKAELDQPSVLKNKNLQTANMLPETTPTAAVYLPKAYCYENLAVFCKLEVKMEKSLKLPVKFRLGEVNYAEMREGKPYTPSIH